MKHKKQQGVALIIAMLIVAIATVVATQIFYEQQINIRRVSNQVQTEYLYQLFLSAEAWQKTILQEDLTKNTFDYLGDIWAKENLPFSAEDAVIKTTLTDAQGCFNLNNLVLKGQVQTAQVKILQNLMYRLKLNPDLVWTLVDWLDADDEPNPTGAEWETYSRLTPSYRAANFRLIDIEELYAIVGWEKNSVSALMPYICVLPPAPQFTPAGRYFAEDALSPININTASEMLLKSLSEKMANANLTPILELQKKTGFQTLDLFLLQLDKDNPQNPALSSTLKKEFLSTDSHYFIFKYTGWLGQLEQNYQSLIYRDTSSKMNVLSRLQTY